MNCKLKSRYALREPAVLLPILLAAKLLKNFGCSLKDRDSRVGLCAGVPENEHIRAVLIDRSVSGGLLHVVDDDNLNGIFCGDELEA